MENKQNNNGLIAIALWMDPELEKRSRLYQGALIGSIAAFIVGSIQFIVKILIS